MSDDDPTPRHRRPRSHWGDTERAAVGRERKNAPPLGVPQLDDLDEAARLPPPPGRFPLDYPLEDTHPIDPATLTVTERALDGRVTRANARIEQAEIRGKKDTANRVMEAIGGLPSATLLRWIWRGLTFLFAAIGALLYKLILVVRTFDAVENRANDNAARIQFLEQYLFLKSQPATPEKVDP